MIVKIIDRIVTRIPSIVTRTVRIVARMVKKARVVTRMVMTFNEKVRTVIRIMKSQDYHNGKNSHHDCQATQPLSLLEFLYNIEKNQTIEILHFSTKMKKDQPDF